MPLKDDMLSYFGSPVLESLPVGMVVQHVSGEIVAANQRACEILRRSMCELTGKSSNAPDWQAIHEDGSAFLGSDHPAMQSLKSGLPLENVVMGLKFDHAQTVWISINSQPLFGEDGNKPYAVVSSFIDITQRKNAEIAAEELAHAAEQAPNGILITDVQQRIQYANKALCSLSGYSVEELLGRTPRIFSSGRTSRETYKSLWVNLSQGLPWKGELHNRRKNGELYIESTLIAPVRSANGVITRYLAIKEDATETIQLRRSLESHQNELEKLVESRIAEIDDLKTKYKTAIDYTHDWETWLDPEGRFIYCSPACQRITGYEPEYFFAKPERLVQIILLDHREAVRCHLENHNSQIPQETLVFPIQQRDGTTRWIEHRCKPVFDEEGVYLGRRASNRDITEEIELRGQLLAAKEIAEKALQAKSEFLANMSHEIRTPLNAVIASSLLMQQDTVKGKQRDRLSRITSSAQHLLGLINDILDFSKIEAGKIKSEKIDFNLPELFDFVSTEVAETARAKGLLWKTELDNALPKVLGGDRLRLAQVLINFASNAVKFTEWGSITLRATQIAETGEKHRIRFEVEDTGIGFDPAKKDRLFKAFEQEDGSTTRRFGGTGLGLAISARIVELMGGEIGAESYPRKGSRFWIEVALDRGQAPTTEKPSLPFARMRAFVLASDAARRAHITELLGTLNVIAQEGDNVRQMLTRIKVADQSQRPYKFVICADEQVIVTDLTEAHKAGNLHGTGMREQPHFALLLCGRKSSVYSPTGDSSIFSAILPESLDSNTLETALQAMCSGTTVVNEATIPPPEAVKPVRDFSSVKYSRILLVEDNRINQEVTLDMLDAVSLHADIADNGREALMMTENRTYDMILMDMQMPVMGGLEATRAIRRLPGYQDTPIIAMTANAMASDKEACLESGMNDYLSKPITPEHLYEMLAKWLASPLVRRLEPTGVAELNVKSIGSPAEEGHTQLPDIPGLDVAYGLKTLQGNVSRYRQLLVRLTLDHRQDAIVIDENVRTGCFVEARRLAHTLKGAAAILGAEDIQFAAAAIEANLAGTRPIKTLDMELGALESALLRLTDALADC